MEASVIVSIVGSLLTAGVSWGIVTTKVNQQAESMKKAEDRIAQVESDCVRREYLHAITNPLQEAIRDIRTDLKDILRIVSSHH